MLLFFHLPSPTSTFRNGDVWSPFLRVCLGPLNADIRPWLQSYVVLACTHISKLEHIQETFNLGKSKILI